MHLILPHNLHIMDYDIFYLTDPHIISKPICTYYFFLLELVLKLLFILRHLSVSWECFQTTLMPLAYKSANDSFYKTELLLHFYFYFKISSCFHTALFFVFISSPYILFLPNPPPRCCFS